MNKTQSLEAINQIKWDKYDSKYYCSLKAKKVFISLVNMENYSDFPNIDSDILTIIGNNHKGTYFPILFEVIDFLIELEKTYENKYVRKTVCAILNNLNYFELENTGYNFGEKIIEKLKIKLSNYSD